MADKKRSHPSAPLYPPSPAPVLNADQLAGALELEFSQIAGQISDAQVPESAVTQHEGALALDGSQVTSPSPSGLFLKDDGTYATPGGAGSLALDDLTDVDTTTTPPVLNDLLQFDGTNFVPAPPGAGSTPTAEDTVSGTVKTDVTEADPVVYTKASTDTLLAAKQADLSLDSVQVVTASLAAGASEEDDVPLGKLGMLWKVVADGPCWVRLYGNTTEAAADSARLITEDPDEPVLADLIFTSGLLTINLAPLLGYSDRQGSPNGNVRYVIKNTDGSTATLTVDFYRITLEP